jgi:hypothetical protein
MWSYAGTCGQCATHVIEHLDIENILLVTGKFIVHNGSPPQP